MQEQKEQKYELFSIVGNRTINFRKWKVKDKKKYLNALREDNLNDIQDALVYDCLEDKNIVLDADEYKYILTQIRIHTFGNDITVEMHCDSCNTDFNYDINLADSYRQSFNPIEEIKSKNYVFKIGNIKNKEEFNAKYADCLTIEQGIYTEFIYKIDSIDGENLSIEEIEEIMDELDADEAEEIFSIFVKNKFKIDNTNDICCPNCSNVETYEFDDFPGFFPLSWYEE